MFSKNKKKKKWRQKILRRSKNHQKIKDYKEDLEED